MSYLLISTVSKRLLSNALVAGAAFAATSAVCCDHQQTKKKKRVTKKQKATRCYCRQFVSLSECVFWYLFVCRLCARLTPISQFLVGGVNSVQTFCQGEHSVTKPKGKLTKRRSGNCNKKNGYFHIYIRDGRMSISR